MPVNLGGRVVPALLVTNMHDSLQFYKEVLGFQQTGYYPIESDPKWTELRRDDAAVHLFTESKRGTFEMPALSGIIYFHPESVEALAAELRDKVPFEWGPEVTDVGMREFGIRDPDGYLLAFTEPA
jgi:catechol 2,3-dioxygenase-like lactoylglutathione lyase family enzyme